jgi:hypothetical protein
MFFLQPVYFTSSYVVRKELLICHKILKYIYCLVCVTTDWVWIDDSIYWPLTGRNYK